MSYNAAIWDLCDCNFAAIPGVTDAAAKAQVDGVCSTHAKLPVPVASLYKMQWGRPWFTNSQQILQDFLCH